MFSIDSSEKLKIAIIIGTTRQNRFSDKPARWIFEKAKEKEGAEFELIDLRDYPLPFFNEPIPPSMVKNGEYPNEIAKQWASKIREADAFIIITAEYNHSAPAVLKNALDYIYAEWNNKPAGFISYGSVGGARAVEHLRQIAVELQMAPIRNAVHIPQPWNLLDEKGNLKEKAFFPFDRNAEAMLSQLIWWAKALKIERKKI